MYFTFLVESFKENKFIHRIYNLKGSSIGLFLALFDKPFVFVENKEEQAEIVANDINFYRTALGKEKVVFLPDPYDADSSGKRSKIIYSSDENDSFVCSYDSFLSPVWTKNILKNKIIYIEKKQTVNRFDLENRLIELGYKNTSIVTNKGDYRSRNWIIDIFPTTSDLPIRIEFFGDEIETIKFFDIDTQTSLENLDNIQIFPAIEYETGIKFSETLTNKKIFFSDSIEKENFETCDNVTYLSRYQFKTEGIDAETFSIKGLGIAPDERKDITDLPKKLNYLLKTNLKKIVFVCSSTGQIQRLKDILRDGGIIAPVIEHKELFAYKGNASIVNGELSSGLYINNLLILTEKELFGERPNFKTSKPSKISNLILTLDDLKTGDYIVHKEHGIGIYRGLIRQKVETIEEDLMIIDYENGRLYLPLYNINVINKYRSQEGFIPKLDKLGSKTWQKTKEKVKKRIYELAENLLNLYAERAIRKGISFSPDNELHKEFDSFFPYEETPDQLDAIKEIKKDMESDKPMDRLICGDVGYGKTEIAMRAAFKAVYDGMQVAMLVPTTILCEQHYRTFKSRFSAFPINIDYLSRFKTKNEQKKILSALSNGDIDILIGTHSLLNKDIKFHKLGLLIIDEEHRFGVRQKERLKELKKDVDVLTLSATPIPRTLYMALSDIRDMSIIETPPEERIAVKTIVSEFNKDLIKEAIKKELERNGQVFFVHNIIKDIYKIADFIHQLIPECRLGVAHGQMPEKELEKVMLDFYNGKINVLVSTAIIGSGLDIPTANTIIINRADKIGLADLYQLKGRVGRSNIKAYAYFLIPGMESITDDAKKRLQAIEEMSYLGAGFRIAMKDLEIRGAGNILGPEQSGHINTVGIDLYIEMLNKAIAELKGIKFEEEPEPEINVKINAFIPENYIDDMNLRLSIYRKIASLKSEDSINKLKLELKDRFGEPPEEVLNLINVMNLKIISKPLKISKISENNGYITINFLSDADVKIENILSLNEKIRFISDGFTIETNNIPERERFHKLINILGSLRERYSLLV